MSGAPPGVATPAPGDPAEDALGRFISPGRKARVRAALLRRLGSVVVVVEAVHRRHNTSAILRSCEAFGVHEVHMVTGPFRPSKGAARGAERWLELHQHPEIGPCIAGLKARGFHVVVADLQDHAHTQDSVPVDQPVAIVFGNELEGVSDEARALADGAVVVPMLGLTESLNVSVAAACILQRLTTRRREQIDAAGDLSEARQASFDRMWQEREDEVRRARQQRNKA